jgi:hypothetical protein
MSGADEEIPALTAAERSRLTDAARQYLTGRYGEDAAAFRLEVRDQAGDGGSVVLWAVHPDDESGAAPGGGRSLELHLDPVTGQVSAEYGFQ